MDKANKLQKRKDRESAKVERESKKKEIAEAQLNTAKEAFNKDPLNKKAKRDYEKAIKNYEKAQNAHNKALKKEGKENNRLEEYESEIENRKKVDVNNDPTFYKAVQLLSKYTDSYNFIKRQIGDTRKRGGRADALIFWDLEAAYGGWYIEKGNGNGNKHLFGPTHYRITDPSGCMVVTSYLKPDSDFEDAIEAYIEKYSHNNSENSNTTLSLEEIKEKINSNVESSIESLISNSKSLIEKEINDWVTKIIVVCNAFPKPTFEYNEFDKKLKAVISEEINKYDDKINRLSNDDNLNDTINMISDEIIKNLRSLIKNEFNELKTQQLSSVKKNALLKCDEFKKRSQFIKDEVESLRNELQVYLDTHETIAINLAYGEFIHTILEDIKQEI